MPPDDRGWTTARDSSDITRLLAYLALTAVGLLAAIGAEQTTAGIEGDLLQLVSRLPSTVLSLLVLGVQVLHVLLFLGIPLVLLVARRWRRWAVYSLGYVLAAIVSTAASATVSPDEAKELPDFGLDSSLIVGWPPSHAVATAVTALLLLSPYLNRAWRSFGWSFVALLSLIRVITSREVALDLLLAIGIGGVVGSALLLAFGRRVRLPNAAEVTASLRRVGLPAMTSTAVPAAGGALPFRSELADGARLHCKVLTAEQYRADSVRRRYRRVRVRQLGEEVAYSTPRRAAAVEAMLAMTAANAGTRTPSVRGLAALGAGDMVLATDEIAGSTLDTVPVDRISDEVLRQLWDNLAAMRSAGIAHRDLQLSNWLLDGAGRVWLLDFSFGEPAAGEGALSVDIAELLSATYAVAGAERAVAAAISSLGAEELATGISHLVPAALTRATRSAVKSQPDGLGPLIDEVAAACGVAEPTFAAVERVSVRQLVMAGMLVVAVYVFLPQLADLPRMIDAIRDADPLMVGAAALASATTYVGVALALSGSVPAPVKLIHSLLAAVAASFASAIAPPGVAHVGLNVRFAQKQGVPAATAVSAAAAKEVTIVVVHIALLVLVAILAGSSGVLGEELDKLPGLQTIGIGAAVVLALIGVAAATPKVRSVVTATVLPAVRHSLDSLRDLVADPMRMLVLFSGALLLQVGYICALYFSVDALGGEIPLVTIALLYLTVGSAATIAPTPGGVGAVEAVLLAALTGVGMAAAPALAAVFLYRLVTFWLPIPIGGVAMRIMLSRNLL